MYRPRNAVGLGVIFAFLGLVYLWLQGRSAEAADHTGVTLLIVLGVAMVYTFAILLRGSREL